MWREEYVGRNTPTTNQNTYIFLLRIIFMQSFTFRNTGLTLVIRKYRANPVFLKFQTTMSFEE